MSENIYDDSKVVEIKPKDLIVYGNKLKLKSNHNKALVKFYAPWCGHCTRLKGLLSKLANEDYKIYAINCDKYHDEVKKLTDKTDININGYPSIFITDTDGILKEYTGNREEEDFKKHLGGNLYGGGINKYKYIINPHTNRKVYIHSKKGLSIIRNYINYFKNS